MGVRRGESKDLTGRVLFGKWTVERLIGVGGTSTVLQARHRNGRRAALKMLHPHLAAQGRTRERFLREGRLANLVDHPGVVAVLDDFIGEDGTAVLVLELVDGESLAARAKAFGGRLQVNEVVDAASAVLDILAVAHDARVIHRDIKPENILLTRDGRYKLTDFGVAGISSELGTLTVGNVALGTPAYMSPEQARGNGRDVDARADLWSIGATMFTLLTGRFVHDLGSARNLIVAAATEPAPPIRSIDPEIQADLAEIVDHALQMDSWARWPNARAMRTALANVRVQPSPMRPVRSVPTTSLTTIPTAPSSWGSHAGVRETSGVKARAVPRWTWALVAGGCLTLVGVVALRGGSDAPQAPLESVRAHVDPAKPPDRRPVDGRHAAQAGSSSAVVSSPARSRSTEIPTESPRPSARSGLPVAAPKKAVQASTAVAVSTNSPRPMVMQTHDTSVAVPDDVLDRRR